MGINQLKGTPWHTEKVHRDGQDDRHYKGRCKFYRYGDDYCSKNYGKCIGSAHCPYYMPISEAAFKERQRNLREKKEDKQGEDDVYWY